MQNISFHKTLVSLKYFKKLILNCLFIKKIPFLDNNSNKMFCGVGIPNTNIYLLELP